MKKFVALSAALVLLAACSTSETTPAAAPEAEAAPPAAAPAPMPPPSARPAAAAPAARAPVRFACTGSKQALSVTYSAGSATTARIQFGTQTLTASQVRSADGGHYSGPKVDFWDKGGKASLTWQGKKYTCKAVH